MCSLKEKKKLSRINSKRYNLRKVCDIRAATAAAFCTYGYLSLCKIFFLSFSEVILRFYIRLLNFFLTNFFSCIQICICVFSLCSRLTFYASLSETYNE